MASFAMCPECRKEYENPSDRRFHAQPIACPACGPKLTLLDPAGARLAEGDAALNQAAEAVLSGRIVALKGLGGFQLLVDATNDESVERLRQRKHRHDKPLAVMIRHIEDVHRRCRGPHFGSRGSGESRGADSAPQAPHGRACPQRYRAVVGAGQSVPGRDAALHPLHHLLMEKIDRPIVCTSGNLSEEPMATTTADALSGWARSRTCCWFTTGRSSAPSTIRSPGSVPGGSRCYAAPGATLPCRSPFRSPRSAFRRGRRT